MNQQTMTLNLPNSEMSVLDALAFEMGMSKTAVMRQALRLYQLATIHGRKGAQIAFLLPDGTRIEPLLPVIVQGPLS